MDDRQQSPDELFRQMREASRRSNRRNPRSYHLRIIFEVAPWDWSWPSVRSRGMTKVLLLGPLVFEWRYNNWELYG